MDLLKKALNGALKLLKNKATHLPEDEALLKRELPGPGLHVHDEQNPLGVHKHQVGDVADGPHTHTPENPEGVHTHGDLIGQSLADGGHYHEDGGLGGHRHKQEDLGITPDIRKPGITI